MLERLRRGPSPASNFATALSITLAAVVQHLAVLEASGLIKTSKVGRVRECSLNPEGFLLAESWMAECRSTWERRLDRLGNLLDED